MGVTREYLRDQMKKLEVNFGKDKFHITQEVFELWYEMFGECEKEALNLAVKRCIEENEFAPNIAGLMKYYRAIVQERSEIIEIMESKYKTLLGIWGESANKETFMAIVKYIYSFPKKERKEAMIELAHKAVSFYNDCRNEARLDIPTIKEYVEGIR